MKYLKMKRTWIAIVLVVNGLVNVFGDKLPDEVKTKITVVTGVVQAISDTLLF